MQQGKRQSFINHMKDTIYGLFDQMVNTNLFNGPTIVALIILETLIYIHALSILLSTVTRVNLDSIYDYLKYIDVTFCVL